jgi:hypothetical protein
VVIFEDLQNELKVYFIKTKTLKTMWKYIVIAWNWVKTHKFETGVFLAILASAFFCFMAGKLAMNDFHYLSGMGGVFGGISLCFNAFWFLAEAINEFTNGKDNG